MILSLIIVQIDTIYSIYLIRVLIIDLQLVW